MYQVLVLDNHPTVGIGVKLVLEQNDDFHVTPVKTGTLALELMTNIKFDVLLCDLHITDLEVAVFIKKVGTIAPKTKIFIFTGFAYDHMFNELIELGVSGFLSKTLSIEEIENKIKLGIRGVTAVPTLLFRKLRALDHEIIYERKPYITSHERKIITYLLSGFSTRKIAESIYLSQRAVEYQLKKLCDKFGVKNRAELLKYVLDHSVMYADYLTTTDIEK